MNLKKGFTLIELLVVIAIIGILASVVLASLNSARTKGKDASAKTSITSVRAQSEIYYNTTASLGGGDNSYGADGVDSVTLSSGVATPGSGLTGVCGDSHVIDLLKAAVIQTGQSVSCTVGGNGSTYAVQSTLNDTSNFCVDSSGFAGEATVGVDTDPGAVAGSVKCIRGGGSGSPACDTDSNLTDGINTYDTLAAGGTCTQTAY